MGPMAIGPWRSIHVSLLLRLHTDCVFNTDKLYHLYNVNLANFPGIRVPPLQLVNNHNKELRL